jgi:hypothetical protein
MRAKMIIGLVLAQAFGAWPVVVAQGPAAEISRDREARQAYFG